VNPWRAWIFNRGSQEVVRVNSAVHRAEFLPCHGCLGLVEYESHGRTIHFEKSEYEIDGVVVWGLYADDEMQRQVLEEMLNADREPH
jgi:hypothetical protein